ncbi:MAG: M23 family metallopeptidase [Candidatus Falkowbacteria bacterium]
MREFNQRHKNQYAIFNRLFSALLIGSITIIVLINNFASRSHPESLINTAQAAPISGLVKNEFDGQISSDELITENAANTKLCEDLSSSYSSDAILAQPLPIVNTNVEQVIQDQSQTCLSGDQSALDNSGAIITGGVIEGGQNTPISTPEVVIKRGISNYTVKSGETISSIARKFSVSVNTILWANNLGAYSTIHEGSVLRIPPTSGVLYKVVKGDNIKTIAKKYNVSTESIISSNNLNDSGKLIIGQELVLSGAKKIVDTVPVYISKPKPSQTISNPSQSELEPAAPSGTKLLWPTQGYRITQYYSWRHTGLDIANHVGTPLYAAEDGVVEFSGWNNGGYGYMVFINHGGGTKTRYGHASKLLVSVGDHVKRGQIVALMGSTGHSTGPHIHFEVYINNQRVNPLNYIR